MPLILGTNSIKDTGFEVANSLRFDDGSSDYLSRTPSGAGNQKTFTISMWIKRCQLGSSVYTWTVGPDGNNNFVLYFDSNDQLEIWEYKPSAYNFRLKPTRKFRDVSAWYHLCVAFDTTQSTSTNRVKVYVNGTQLTDFDTTSYPSLNYDTFMNSTSQHWLGKYTNQSYYFDGYICEMVVVDGTALDPTSFGEFDSDSPNIWKPIDVSGLTFGTNGFHLDFENSSSLGADVSGNSNNFTVNNLTSVDQSIDTCTNNFATLNPLDNYYFNSTFSEGNLKVVTSSGNYAVNTSTFWLSGGKWYWEVKVVTTSTNDMIGIANAVSTSTSNYLGHNANGYAYRGDGSVFYNYAGTSSTVSGFGSGILATYGNGDILMIAMDLDNSKLYFGKNGTWGNSGDPTSGSTGTGAVSIVAVGSTPNGFYTPALSEWHNGASLTAEINFGSPSFSISSGNADANGYGNFEYSVPSGYYSINTKNLAEFG